MKINMVALNAQSKVTKLCRIDNISKEERERILDRQFDPMDFFSSDSDPYHGKDIYSEGDYRMHPYIDVLERFRR